MELDNTTAAPAELLEQVNKAITTVLVCLLYTSDAADE